MLPFIPCIHKDTYVAYAINTKRGSGVVDWILYFVRGTGNVLSPIFDIISIQSEYNANKSLI